MTEDAAELKILLDEAKQLGEEIERKAVNFKKETKVRRAKERTKEYGESFSNLWQLFVENDGKIKEIDENGETRYIKAKYYEFVKDIYDDVVERINERMKEMEENEKENEPDTGEKRN